MALIHMSGNCNKTTIEKDPVQHFLTRQYCSCTVVVTLEMLQVALSSIYVSKYPALVLYQMCFKSEHEPTEMREHPVFFVDFQQSCRLFLDSPTAAWDFPNFSQNCKIVLSFAFLYGSVLCCVMLVQKTAVVWLFDSRKRAEAEGRKGSFPCSKAMSSHHPTDPVELRRINFQTPGEHDSRPCGQLQGLGAVTCAC